MARQLDELIEAPPEVPRPDAGDVAPYLNREVSLLDFQERVLALAEDTGLPLLERAKFLAIFASNVDEFFQVRVAGLKDQVAAGVDVPSADGLTPVEQLAAIRDRLTGLVDRHSRAFVESVVPATYALPMR